MGKFQEAGLFIDTFEADLAKICGAQHVIAVVNGTAALHLALKVSGVQPDDEVLTQSLSFAATANAIWNCTAIPHFVDVCEKPFGVDVEKLSAYLDEITEWQGEELINKHTGRRISALVPMHIFGHPADMEGLAEITKKYRLKLVADAAEALGSTYKGRGIAAYGDVSIFSFNGNKIITTGGGGALATNDDDLARLIRHVATTAKLPHKWAFLHDQVGYNYRMPNLNAALGCAQLERFPNYLKRKRQLAQRYQDYFADMSALSILAEADGYESNHWLNALILNKADLEMVEQILTITHDQDIYTRPIWTPYTS